MGVVPFGFYYGGEDTAMSDNASTPVTGEQLCAMLQLVITALEGDTVVPSGETQTLAKSILAPAATLVLQKLQPSFSSSQELVLAPKEEVTKLAELMKAYQKAIADAASLRETAIVKAEQRVISHADKVWRAKSDLLKKVEERLSAQKAKLDGDLRDLEDKRKRLTEDVDCDRKEIDKDRERLMQLEVKLEAQERSLSNREALLAAKQGQANRAAPAVLSAGHQHAVQAGKPSHEARDVEDLLALKGEEIYEIFLKAKQIVAA